MLIFLLLAITVYISDHHHKNSLERHANVLNGMNIFKHLNKTRFQLLFSSKPVLLTSHDLQSTMHNFKFIIQ